MRARPYEGIVEQKLGRKLGFKLIKYKEHEERIVNMVAPRNNRDFESYCHKQDALTLVDLSIDKWRYIAALLLAGIEVEDCGGIISCPLCCAYKKDVWSDCGSCPISEEDWNHEGCAGTPYDDYEGALLSNEYWQAAKDEIRFLRRIRKWVIEGDSPAPA